MNGETSRVWNCVSFDGLDLGCVLEIKSAGLVDRLVTVRVRDEGSSNQDASGIFGLSV